MTLKPANWREIEMMRLINILRAEEGDSVTLICDNPDFNMGPNNAVECHGYWTDWWDVRFEADTLLDALSAAFIAYNNFKATGKPADNLRRMARIGNPSPTAPTADPVQGAGEPVAWQYRLQYDDGIWSNWMACTKTWYDSYKVGHCAAETRALGIVNPSPDRPASAQGAVREKSLSDFSDAEIANEHGWRVQRALGDPRIGIGTEFTPKVAALPEGE